MGFIELRVQTADGKSSPNPYDIKRKLTQLDFKKKYISDVKRNLLSKGS